MACQEGLASCSRLFLWKYAGAYLDLRMDTRQRRRMVSRHYRLLLGRHRLFAALVGRQGTELWQAEDADGRRYSISIGQADICPMEGEIEMVFRDDKGRLGFLTFLLTDGEALAARPGLTLLVGGIQGGYGRREDFRRAAKSNGEITPINMLIVAVRAVAAALDVPTLFAIPDVGQASRSYADAQMQLSYDRTWSDAGGMVTDAGFFAIETYPAPRSLGHLTPAHRKRALRKNARKVAIFSEIRDRIMTIMEPTPASVAPLGTPVALQPEPVLES